MTNPLAFDRYCAEIIEQTRLFRDALKGVTLDARVPACPEWTLRELAVHVGDGHRHAAEVVRTRATSFLSPGDVPRHGGPAGLPEADVAPGAYAEALSTWLSESAQLVSDELRVAGEESPAWTLTGEQRAGFWARRRTHEALVHRLDAASAASAAGAGADGAPSGVAAELAADCLDELFELTSSREALAQWPPLRSLSVRAGETLHLHATDDPPAASPAEWMIRIEEEGFTWERAHEKATTAVRGPLIDLLLVVFRRLPPGSGRVEVLGDAELLDFWLERVGF
ncbi:maleylpyruvate isomerase family protein [Streptomyces sp. HNM0575]|uniref:maleylpyruvate isomerase N-terminal domain-containing protein n=1 Tax=Streptomyces sp. HNM0575 TaxID=2716338 RepID=UPI00145E15A7|nr:maleylpyruvate isomerase N-terminal domain-containing protein [Streptomyces sp. HNM0575]NLU76790.1 maleylpyruvate isomerase family protein [Streptomyces sp. HNM0575]